MVPRAVPASAVYTDGAVGSSGGDKAGTGVVDLDIEGGTLSDVPHLASYSPAADDVVEVLSAGVARDGFGPVGVSHSLRQVGAEVIQ